MGELLIVPHLVENRKCLVVPQCEFVLKGRGFSRAVKPDVFVPALQFAEKLGILNEREGHEFQWLRKNSPSYLFLGGAALQRCGKRFVLIAPLGAEVALFAAEGFFPQPLPLVPCSISSLCLFNYDGLLNSVVPLED